MKRALLLALVVLAGCGRRGSLYKEPLKPLPLLATSSQVVLVVPQTQRAVVLTPGESTPGALTLSKGARFAVRVPGSETVAILSGTAKAPKLDLVDVEAGAVETLDLPGFFDAIHFSPDGRFGVLVYGEGGGSGVVARNLNEIALLNVASRNVARLQLDTESLAPIDVLFGPVEPGRQLVAVTLERGVAVFDALHPGVAPRRISIRPSGSSSESTVLETVFSRGGKYLFLRASGLDDVIVVELGNEVGQPVSASINFVSGGVGLTDIEAPPPGYEDAVLAVYSTSSEAWLLDARGISDNAKKLTMTAPLSQVHQLQGSRVLLWNERSKTVAAWDIADGRTGSVVLDTAFTQPTLVDALDKGIFPTIAALSVVTVLEETNRLRPKIQSIQLTSQLGASVLDENNQRLFFTVNGSPTVVTMDLRTMQLAEVSLDQSAQQLFHLQNGDWLVADHGGTFGDLTLLPAGATERSTARRYSDFAFTDDFDRPGDAP
jgi:hypothetical protein